MADVEPPAKRSRGESSIEAAAPSTVPITLLSGFLGAGKTTLLKHLLENKSGARIGIIVNDVAEVNIDASLVAVKSGTDSGQASQEDTVQMANGCVCCSASEELLQSIGKLMDVSEKRKLQWDHIVIETTGVAEPREVRDNLANCAVTSPEMLRGTILHTMVTVIDSSNFLTEFQKRNKVEQRTDLGSSEFTDGNRQVVDLMCEQIECADILIMNKTDLTSADELTLLHETVKQLNPHAAALESVRGQVELSSVLGAAGENSVASLDEDGDVRRLVAKVNEQEAKETEHEHGHAEKNLEHGHHEHGHQETTEPQGHEHEHAHESHGHADCPPDCDKDAKAAAEAPAHEHDHAQAGNRPIGRETRRFGITSFCYQRRRPFHPHRLMQVIRQLPVRQETLALAKALDERSLDASKSASQGASHGEASPMHALIRAKGFVWLSNSHAQMFYWALAGKHFELKQYATWWQCVERDEWPTDKKEVNTILKDFDGVFGDHRNELVFIGVKMDKAAIVKLLDACLLTDNEIELYKQNWMQ